MHFRFLRYGFIDECSVHCIDYLLQFAVNELGRGLERPNIFTF